VNLLIQTRGLHTARFSFFDLFRVSGGGKAGKVEKMGNLQVTSLHRRHGWEGAGLLRFWGVGEMSFDIEKVGSGVAFQSHLL
jgi:hypothetical protein